MSILCASQNGYGRRLMFERSWVWIKPPGWTFFTFIFVRIVMFTWKDKKIKRNRGREWPIFKKEPQSKFFKLYLSCSSGSRLLGGSVPWSLLRRGRGLRHLLALDRPYGREGDDNEAHLRDLPQHRGQPHVTDARLWRNFGIGFVGKICLIKGT